jgi:hypothetical protein
MSMPDKSFKRSGVGQLFPRTGIQSGSQAKVIDTGEGLLLTSRFDALRILLAKAAYQA